MKSPTRKFLHFNFFSVHIEYTLTFFATHFEYKTCFLRPKSRLLKIFSSFETWFKIGLKCYVIDLQRFSFFGSTRFVDNLRFLGTPPLLFLFFRGVSPKIDFQCSKCVLFIFIYFVLKKIVYL